LAGFALALLAFARFVQSDISFVTTFVQRSGEEGCLSFFAIPILARLILVHGS
jgi:hypothetical protein